MSACNDSTHAHPPEQTALARVPDATCGSSLVQNAISSLEDALRVAQHKFKHTREDLDENNDQHRAVCARSRDVCAQQKDRDLSRVSCPKPDVLPQ